MIPSSYWRIVREPRYSLTFALPLLLVYEVLAFSLSGHQFAGVRNGADVLLKSVFLALGGRNGLIVFGALVVGVGSWLVWRDYRRSRSIQPGIFALMATESILYALAFGLVAGTLTVLLLPGLATILHLPDLPADLLVEWSLPTVLMISLGAGIYEELLFRVILVSGLAWLARRVFGWNGISSGVFAVMIGALIFAAFHYIGPYGDRLQLASFTFRTVAGVLFSGLYLLRGFGITAWTHALYDVFLALGVMG
jgi:membrane protease YdiL (CAAX protease family)